MKFPLSIRLVLLALMATSVNADTRMQVDASSSPIFTQPSPSAQQIGKAVSGEILFVSRIDGDWAAIAPPDRLAVWLNKDFIEGNRVIAKSIQIRSGPGVQYDVIGTLERGAPVMPRGEEGEWTRIAPPSSSILWVKKSDLSEIRPPTSPIREVATAPQPALLPEPSPMPKPHPEAPAKPFAPAPAPQPAPEFLDVAPAQSFPSPSPTPSPTVKVVPSTPHAPEQKPAAQRPASAPAPASVPAISPAPSPMAASAAPAQPVTDFSHAPTPIKPAATAPLSDQTSIKPPPPVLRPITALPGSAPTPPPPSAAVPLPASRTSVRRAVTPSAVPAPVSAVVTHKSRDVDVPVDPDLVDDLDLDEDIPSQGKGVQVEGELRNAPFMAASPSRYRLVEKDENGNLEMACHIHGDSRELRRYIGKDVSIRGREYWVENSDMPVVVVGQIVPLAPANEPVMF